MGPRRTSGLTAPRQHLLNFFAASAWARLIPSNLHFWDYRRVVLLRHDIDRRLAVRVRLQRRAPHHGGAPRHLTRATTPFCASWYEKKVRSRVHRVWGPPQRTRAPGMESPSDPAPLRAISSRKVRIAPFALAVSVTNVGVPGLSPAHELLASTFKSRKFRDLDTSRTRWNLNAVFIFVLSLRILSLAERGLRCPNNAYTQISGGAAQNGKGNFRSQDGSGTCRCGRRSEGPSR
jgi:hypothetical protein